MKKGKRIICIMVAAIMLMLPAAGCASRLSANFDEREVQEKRKKSQSFPVRERSAKLTECSAR